jgi:hypothetical protein
MDWTIIRSEIPVISLGKSFTSFHGLRGLILYGSRLDIITVRGCPDRLDANLPTPKYLFRSAAKPGAGITFSPMSALFYRMRRYFIYSHSPSAKNWRAQSKPVPI